MTESTLPLLSVRGEARRTVAPDSATLHGAVTAVAPSKPEALSKVGAALDALTEELGKVGGTPRTTETERTGLTWSAYSATTHVEKEQDPQTGHRTGPERVHAWIAVIVAVRDFALLDGLGTALAQQDSLSIQQTLWKVDADNPVWKAVRADAIFSAIAKGRDYAVALGGSLAEVLHIADVGLLGGEGGGRAAMYAASALRGSPVDQHAGPGAPSLDPVPQELVAAIEARFTMTPVALGES